MELPRMCIVPSKGPNRREAVVRCLNPKSDVRGRWIKRGILPTGRVILERASENNIGLCSHLRKGFDLLKRSKEAPLTLGLQKDCKFLKDDSKDKCSPTTWPSKDGIELPKCDSYCNYVPPIRSKNTLLQRDRVPSSQVGSINEQTRSVKSKPHVATDSCELETGEDKSSLRGIIPDGVPDSVQSNESDSDSDSLNQKKAVCDALIVQKLLEIRNHIAREEKMPKKRSTSTSLEAETEKCGTDLGNVMSDNELEKRSSRSVEVYRQGLLRDQKDFVYENALRCTRLAPRIPARKVVDDISGHCRTVDPHRMVFKKDYGQLPEYLRQRNQEISRGVDEEDEDFLDAGSKVCRTLTLAERQTLIENLSESWEHLFLEYQKLPLFACSNRVLKRKGDIESKLRDLESDIRLISRHGRLFVSNVPADSHFLWN